MMYDEGMVAPMREELSRLGCKETRSVADVDQFLARKDATTMVVVNSVCGCAAANARPAVNLAWNHPKRPEAITVFAGNDAEATARARSYFAGFRPSSPSIGIIKNGECVFLLERHQIEGRSAHDISKDLTSAFENYC